MLFTSLRQYSHQLLVRLEWCSQLEGDLELGQSHQIYPEKEPHGLIIFVQVLRIILQFDIQLPEILGA